MTAEQTGQDVVEQDTVWKVEETDGKADRPQAVVIGSGYRFILYTAEDATQLTDLLNAQTHALTEAAQLARKYDCGKTSLQKAAMVPCRNLPHGEECYACQITRARLERNSFCICDDDDELPTGPAEYCPVHGNTYKYVLQEEARVVDLKNARAAAVEQAEAAEARLQQLEAALRQIEAMTGAPDAARLAREALA